MANRWFLFLILLVTWLGTASCGSNSASSPDSSTAILDSIPGLPQGDASGSTNRSTSSYQFTDADLYAVQGAAMSGGQLTIDASGLTWAILGVDTGGQYPSSVTLNGTMNGLYVGVGNYTLGRWNWIGGPYNAAGTISLPASGTLSPGGSFYLALVCPDTASATITIDLNITTAADAWNFMVWIAGDNNLAPDAVTNLNDMESVGSTDEIRIFAGYDIDGSLVPGVSGLDQVHFIKVVKDTNANQIVTDGDAANLSFSATGYNSADPAHVEEFLAWVQTNFPAQHNVFVLWDHGDGWLPGWKSSSAAPRGWQRSRQASGILGDDTDGDLLLTDNADVAAALSAVKFDLLCFDACNMAHIEALYDYRNSASYINCSEALFPGEGYPYGEILNAWSAALPVTGASLGQIIADEVEAFYNGKEYVHQSTVDAAKIAPLTTALAGLATAVTAQAATESSLVKDAISTALEPELSDGERDLRGFLSYYSSVTADVTIVNALSTAISAYDDCVVYTNQYGLDNATGIAAYLPSTAFFSTEYQDMYEPKTFNTATGWLDMLKATGVPNGGGGGVTVHWEPGDRVEIAWGDSDADLDLIMYDAEGNMGMPWDPGLLDYCMEFSEDAPGDAGATAEWARLKTGAPTGTYYMAIGMNDYYGSPVPPTYVVSVKLYDSTGTLKQDMGTCTIELYGYELYATMIYSPT